MERHPAMFQLILNAQSNPCCLVTTLIDESCDAAVSKLIRPMCMASFQRRSEHGTVDQASSRLRAA
jgi:hypothetical protein